MRARLQKNQALRSIFLRAYVYLSGFLLMTTISSKLGANEFGYYSVVQSISEFAVIVATLGSGLLYTRAAHSVPGGARFSLLPTLRYGLPAALLLMLLALNIYNINGFVVIFTASLLVVFFAVNTLNSYQLRGLGHVDLFNYEPGLRATIFLALIFLLDGFSDFSTLEDGLIICLATYVVMAIIFARVMRGISYEEETIPTNNKLHMLVYSALGFVSKKSDLLVVSLFHGMAVVANFKISFLLSEVAYQMANAIGISKTSEFLKKEGLVDNRTYISIVATGVSISGLILIFSDLIGYLFFKSYDFSGFMLWLCLYFSIKSFSLAHDYTIIFLVNPESVNVVSFAVAIAKLSCLAGACFLLGDEFYIVYPVIGLIELYLLERFLRKKTGSGYLMLSRWAR